jgi:hypothetical protein
MMPVGQSGPAVKFLAEEDKTAETKKPSGKESGS